MCRTALHFSLTYMSHNYDSIVSYCPHCSCCDRHSPSSISLNHCSICSSLKGGSLALFARTVVSSASMRVMLLKRGSWSSWFPVGSSLRGVACGVVRSSWRWPPVSTDCGLMSTFGDRYTPNGLSQLQSAPVSSFGVRCRCGVERGVSSLAALLLWARCSGLGVCKPALQAGEII